MRPNSLPPQPPPFSALPSFNAAFAPQKSRASFADILFSNLKFIAAAPVARVSVRPTPLPPPPPTLHSKIKRLQPESMCCQMRLLSQCAAKCECIHWIYIITRRRISRAAGAPGANALPLAAASQCSCVLAALAALQWGIARAPTAHNTQPLHLLRRCHGWKRGRPLPGTG